MKFASPNEIVEFSPPGEEAKPPESRAVYRLKVPSRRDKLQLRRAVGAAGGRQFQPLDFLTALREACETLLEGDGKAEALAVIAAHVERLQAFYAQIRAQAFDVATEEGRTAFAAAAAEADTAAPAINMLEKTVGARWPTFAAMLADNGVYPALAALEAARLFLMGWNLSAKFTRTAAGVPDRILDLIPDAHLAAIGAKVEEMLAPTEAEAKNSGSPSPGGSSPSPSTAARTQQEATN